MPQTTAAYLVWITGRIRFAIVVVAIAVHVPSWRAASAAGPPNFQNTPFASFNIRTGVSSLTVSLDGTRAICVDAGIEPQTFLLTATERRKQLQKLPLDAQGRVQFSPNGKDVLYVSLDRKIVLSNLSGGQPKIRVRCEGAESCAFGRDGKSFCCVGADARVLTSNGGDKLTAIHPDCLITAVAYGLESIYVGFDDGAVESWDLAFTKRKYRRQFAGGAVKFLDSRDKDGRLAVVAGSGNVFLTNDAEDAPADHLKGCPDSSSSATFMGAEPMLLVSSDEGVVEVFNFESKKVEWQWTSSVSPLSKTFCAVSSDGAVVVVGDIIGQIDFWHRK